MYEKHTDYENRRIDEKERDYTEAPLSVSVLPSFSMNVPVEKQREKDKFLKLLIFYRVQNII